MGLFVAQALTVLLGTTLIALSFAILALLMAAARGNKARTVKVIITPAPGRFTRTDDSARSMIDLSSAAPSRAPPVSDLRAPVDAPADLPPDDDPLRS